MMSCLSQSGSLVFSPPRLLCHHGTYRRYKYAGDLPVIRKMGIDLYICNHHNQRFSSGRRGNHLSTGFFNHFLRKGRQREKNQPIAMSPNYIIYSTEDECLSLRLRRVHTNIYGAVREHIGTPSVASGPGYLLQTAYLELRSWAISFDTRTTDELWGLGRTTAPPVTAKSCQQFPLWFPHRYLSIRGDLLSLGRALRGNRNNQLPHGHRLRRVGRLYNILV